MHNDKRLSKEDTWRPADLRKYVREDGSTRDSMRKMDEVERRHRGSKSTERYKPEDPRQEREKHRERRDVDTKGRYAEHQKEVSQDRRKEKERDRRGEDRERRHDTEVDANHHSNEYRENRDHRRQKEEKHERERHRERERDRMKERGYEGDQNRRREERDKERRREERDREHRSERRKHEERDEGGREKHHKEHRDRERDRNKERERRHKEEKEERRHSDRREKDGHKEQHRKRSEEQERTYKDRRHHEDKEKRDYKYKEYIETKASSEEVRSHRSDREMSVRDKYKERRQKEDEDAEGKNSSKKSSSQIKEDTEPPKTEIVNEEDLTVREYEDDFEDYDEDFEEMDESESEGEKEQDMEEETKEPAAEISEEIQVIQRAMDEENKQVRRSNSTQRTNQEQQELSGSATDFERKSSKRGKFIDFVAAKQRELNKMVVSKQKKRSTELLRLIDLDFSRTFSHLDLPPVNEYDMYIRSFGSANTRQAYVQCNEDNAERDVQTDEIEVSEKWTQHPPEHSGACGDPNLISGNKIITEMKFDTQSLTAFLRAAAQVTVVLLEEDQAEKKSVKKQETGADLLSFSDGGLQLNTQLPFLHGRQISLVHFSKDQRHTMVSVHEPTSKRSAARLDSCTIMCIWNIWEPSRPQKILIYESEVLCCCFSPGKANLVFAGTSVGSVALWDLREHVGYHQRLKIGGDEWTFRQPTFCTDAVMANAAHFSAVTSVEVVPSTAAGVQRPEVPLLSSEEESAGLSSQLASLDESGILNFWVVVQLPVTNEAGSQTDLGLRPGGQVKLLHSSSRQTAGRASTRDVGRTCATSSLQLSFLPTDSNHFFISTNMGVVTHGTVHGLKASPRSFSFMDLHVRPVDVSAVDFSPYRRDLFLVGCGDGSIRLHTVSQEQPLSEWRSSTSGEAVVALQWNQTKSTVFCVLDAASNIYVWDLLQSNAEPVITERIGADRATAMSVFGDSAQQNPYSGIALAHTSGKIELHYFTKTLTSPSEEEKLDRIMNEALNCWI